MHLVLMFYGSRGDVQPGLALGLELQRRGHGITMLIPPNFVDFAGHLGLAATAVGLDTSSVWDTPDAQRILESRNPYTKVTLAAKTIKRGFAAFDADLVSLFGGPEPDIGKADAVVSGPLCQERMSACADRLGVPLTVVRFGPFSENGVIGAIPGLTRRAPAAINRATWRLMDSLGWLFAKRPENRFRSSLGVKAASGSMQQRLTRTGAVQIQAYDEFMFPGLAQEWGEAKPIVGYFDLPSDRRGALTESSQSDTALWEWLGAGDKPVHITFGSVPIADPDELTGVIVRACERVGCRALITMKGRTEGVDPDRPDVYFALALDHSVVLPQCTAVVHHGGAGTTAAGLRAGLPTMVCHGGADQAYWGSQIARLEIGTTTRLKGLDEDTLVAGLTTILSPATAVRARALASALVSPDAALARAADILEGVAN